MHDKFRAGKKALRGKGAGQTNKRWKIPGGAFLTFISSVI
jgi:hypothetical protein